MASSTERGFCARGAVVEIDERLAVDLAKEDREIGADALDVEARVARQALSAIDLMAVSLSSPWLSAPWPRSRSRASQSAQPRLQRLAQRLVLDLVDRLADERLRSAARAPRVAGCRATGR